MIEALDKYVENARAELSARNNEWPLDLSQVEARAVIGGLLARIVSLATQMASSPSIWNAHIAALILRAMVDAILNMAWVLEAPTVRAKEFVEYGLGQAKLEIEHLKAAGYTEDDPFVVEKQAWLRSQRLDAFTAVNVGSWSGSDSRTIADSLGYGDMYRLQFGPFSAAVHSHWHHIAKYNLGTCLNPLHRFHRIPTDSELDVCPEYMFTAAELLQEAFNRFDDKLGLSIAVPSALANLEAAFDRANKVAEGQEAVAEFLRGNTELSTVLKKLGKPSLPDIPPDISRTAYLRCLFEAASCVSTYIRLAVSATPPCPPDDRWRMLMTGHAARLYKLYDSFLFLAARDQQETATVQLAAVFATVINMQALISTPERAQTADKFVRFGLRYEKRLRNSINACLHKPPLRTEERMLNSIDLAFERAGVTVAAVSCSRPNHETELFRNAKNADALRLYDFGYLTAASSLYGTWHDIEFNQLLVRDEMVMPDMDYQLLQPQIIEAASSACLSIMADYVKLSLRKEGRLLRTRILHVLEWFQNTVAMREYEARQNNNTT